MNIVSLYTEVQKLLDNTQGAHSLALEFRCESSQIHNHQKPLTVQLHDINRFWNLRCASIVQDSLNVRTCFENFTGDNDKDLQSFVKSWLANFNRYVIPFFMEATIIGGKYNG